MMLRSRFCRMVSGILFLSDSLKTENISVWMICRIFLLLDGWKRNGSGQIKGERSPLNGHHAVWKLTTEWLPCSMKANHWMVTMQYERPEWGLGVDAYKVKVVPVPPTNSAWNMRYKTEHMVQGGWGSINLGHLLTFHPPRIWLLWTSNFGPMPIPIFMTSWLYNGRFHTHSYQWGMMPANIGTWCWSLTGHLERRKE